MYFSDSVEEKAGRENVLSGNCGANGIMIRPLLARGGSKGEDGAQRSRVSQRKGWKCA